MTCLKDGWSATQDLENLKKWIHMNLMRFKTTKCKAMHLGQGSSQNYNMFGDKWIESRAAEKDLGVLVNK